jgi:hypothetical protein
MTKLCAHAWRHRSCLSTDRCQAKRRPCRRTAFVSQQGNPVEIVVASDIHVRYLQGTPDGEHMFRASQRFALRVKDNTAVALIKR